MDATDAGKRPFLVCYDYGMGGLWVVVRARSAAEIVARYPDVTVVDHRPTWMSADRYDELDVEDIDEPPQQPGALWASLVDAQRERDREH